LSGSLRETIVPALPMRLKTTNTNTSTFLGVIAAVFYVSISVLMTFFNKAVLTHYNFKYANFILLIQLISTVLLLQLFKLLKLIQFDRFNFEKAKKLYIVSLFYAFNAGIALAALSSLNIPVYGSLKRLTLVMVLIGEWILLKRKSSLRIIFAVSLIIIGAVVMGIGDIEFNMLAYFMATVSCFSQTCYLLFLAKTKLDTGLNTFEMLFYNCLLSAPMLFCLVLLTGELRNALSYSRLFDIEFLVCLCGAVLLGSILNYAIFICTLVNSPLTLVVTGQLKTVLSTFFGLFAFGGVDMRFLNLLGLCVNTLGGLLYAWFKYLEQQKKDHSDKEIP
jgi:solute carrier family 35 protein